MVLVDADCSHTEGARRRMEESAAARKCTVVFYTVHLVSQIVIY